MLFCMYVCTTYALIINNKIIQIKLNHILSKRLNSIRTWGDDDCLLPNWSAYVKRGEVHN